MKSACRSAPPLIAGRGAVTATGSDALAADFRFSAAIDGTVAGIFAGPAACRGDVGLGSATRAFCLGDPRRLLLPHAHPGYTKPEVDFQVCDHSLGQ